MFRPAYREPRALFLAQRNGAEARGIPWRFTYEEWWQLWEPHWERRVPDKLCLCRNADAGAYEVGNCRIDTALNNLLEQHQVMREKPRPDPVVFKKPPQSPPPPPFEPYDLQAVMRDIERSALLEALHSCRWNMTRAAQLLGLTFRQMRYKVQEHRLDTDA